MKKPEPIVKADETGPPKAAVAGAVGVAVAIAWRLFISRMRNAGGAGRNNAWKTVTADAKEKLAAAGFDIVAPLKLRWYNEIAPDSAKIAPGGAMGEDALVILVGNSAALWPVFCDAHNARPEIGDAENPVDTYVDIEVNRVFRGKMRRVFYAHETKPGRLVAVQRMAHVAGVAHLDERSHLSIHPTLGPWLAFRAVVVLDDARGPGDRQKPRTPPNPLAFDPSARARVDEAFDAALDGYEAPGGPSEGQWRLWVAVRDAVEPGHPARYPEDQVAYHYNCLDGRERARIRSRLRGGSNLLTEVVISHGFLVVQHPTSIIHL